MINFIKLTKEDTKCIFKIIRQKIVYDYFNLYTKHMPDDNYNIAVDEIKYVISNILTSYIYGKTSDYPTDFVIDKLLDYFIPRTLSNIISYISHRFTKTKELKFVIVSKYALFEDIVINGTEKIKYGDFDYFSIVESVYNNKRLV